MSVNWEGDPKIWRDLAYAESYKHRRNGKKSKVEPYSAWDYFVSIALVLGVTACVAVLVRLGQ